MTLELKPMHPLFVAEACGVDLKKPIQDTDRKAINAAMNQYGVLVWRGQDLSGDEQIAFSETFGPLDIGLKRVFQRKERLHDERLIDISNVDLHGEVNKRDSPKNLSSFANQLWHSDSSFMSPKAAYSMLHALITPGEGGNTEFTDLRAAYDSLSPALQREVEGLSAEHYALHTRQLLGDDAYTDEQKKAIAPAVWPLVQTHSGSGRKLLFVGVHAHRIIDWPVAEGRIFLLDLLEHATQSSFVYSHQWRVGDLLMWDNRSTLHRGRRYNLNERRELRRTTLNDTPQARLDA